MPRSHTTSIVGALGALSIAFALAGCSGTPAAEPSEAASEPTVAATSPAPSATPSPEAAASLTQAELSEAFTSIQFTPGQYENTDALLDSVYPGLTVSDASCLAPFGVGWADDIAAGAEASALGTSVDRSMTAVAISDPDEAIAEDALASAEEALERCSGDTVLFEMSGVPVEMQIERSEPDITGADDAFGWRATGDVGGNAFTLVGITAQVGGTALALVGWDPATNENYVPQATQMFVDAF
jgi:hypothetical protein